MLCRARLVAPSAEAASRSSTPWPHDANVYVVLTDLGAEFHIRASKELVEPHLVVSADFLPEKIEEQGFSSVQVDYDSRSQDGRYFVDGHHIMYATFDGKQ